MSDFDFKFDRGTIDKVVTEGVQRIARNLQSILDDVRKTHAGSPVSEISSALTEALTRAEFTPDAEQVDEWAATIRSGERIVVQL